MMERCFNPYLAYSNDEFYNKNEPHPYGPGYDGSRPPISKDQYNRYAFDQNFEQHNSTAQGRGPRNINWRAIFPTLPTVSSCLFNYPNNMSSRNQYMPTFDIYRNPMLPNPNLMQPRLSITAPSFIPKGVPPNNQMDVLQLSPNTSAEYWKSEVYRALFTDTTNHPIVGSPEYYRFAEDYATYGREFGEFPNSDNRIYRINIANEPMCAPQPMPPEPAFDDSMMKYAAMSSSNQPMPSNSHPPSWQYREN